MAKFVEAKFVTGSAAQVFAEFGRGVRNRVLRKVVNVGTKIVFDAVKPLAPKATGLLRLAQGRVVRTYKNSGVVVGVVGTRKDGSFRRVMSVKKDKVFRRNKWGKAFRVLKPTAEQLKRTQWPHKYTHLVIGGTKFGARGNNFIKRGYDASKSAASSAMLAKLQAEMPLEAKKVADKKAKKAAKK